MIMEVKAMSHKDEVDGDMIFVFRHLKASHAGCLENTFLQISRQSWEYQEFKHQIVVGLEVA